MTKVEGKEMKNDQLKKIRCTAVHLTSLPLGLKVNAIKLSSQIPGPLNNCLSGMTGSRYFLDTEQALCAASRGFETLLKRISHTLHLFQLMRSTDCGIVVRGSHLGPSLLSNYDVDV